MQIIHGYKDCSAQNTVIALGNFDGVHIGHKVVLEKTIEIAREKHLTSAALTFEPHPICVLVPDISPMRITPFPEKASIIQAQNIEILYCINFTKEFAQIDAKDFIKAILVGKLGAKHIVIGHDFIFGKNRSGNADLLRNMSCEYGYDVTQIEPVRDSGELFSSTNIREFIKKGNIKRASEMLGHDFVIEGIVVNGDKRGRTIGFPTANISLDNYIRPAFGVYSANIKIEDENIFRKAMVNIGKRPSFDKETEILEAYILDFDMDIYGKSVRVELLEFIRHEKKFDNINALKKQIQKDLNELHTLR